MKKTWQEKQKESIQSGYSRAKELAQESIDQFLSIMKAYTDENSQ